MNEAWIINGIPCSEKTTIARCMSERFGRSAHLEGDLIHEMIIGGRVEHSTGAEAERQAALTDRNLRLLAESFVSEGFVPIIDFIVDTKTRLSTYTHLSADLSLYLVTLVPPLDLAKQRFYAREGHETGSDLEDLEAKLRSELTGKGFWLDTSNLTPGQTVDLIMAQKTEALQH